MAHKNDIAIILFQKADFIAQHLSDSYVFLIVHKT